MMLRFYLFTIILLTALFSQAQVNITGKVINNKNEALPGVSVKAENGSGTSTDLDGRFKLVVPSSTKQTFQITFTAVGFAAKTITTEPNTTSNLVIVLETEAAQLQGVVVSARAGGRKENINGLIAFQKNTNTVASVISAEAIRRSPDRNTGEVLKRVPGTSIQEGKYLVVRGLADRYNQAMLNGILLSSTEPDRKTFSFDLFPAPMIDNIVINKAFVPELPGEWAGGLVQVHTKEIPDESFLTIQAGTGFNSQTIGRDFYRAPGGKLDWLGVEDGTRALPEGLPVKNQFAQIEDQSVKNNYAKQFRNVWTSNAISAPLNSSFQLNGGFTGKFLGKKSGGILSVVYNQNNRNLQFNNSLIANEKGDREVSFNNQRYSTDVLAGAMANFSVHFNNRHKVTLKNILNVNTTDYVTRRTGRDYILGPGVGELVSAEEIGFRQNTFFNTQIVGEHHFTALAGIRAKWFGGFNILDQYIPDQRRLFYTKDGSDNDAPYYALLSSGAGASQKSGSIFYSNLNDYIYNAGVDVSKSFRRLGYNQTVKAGYLFQVKDRLFDSRPFFIRTFENHVKLQGPETIFSAENFDKNLLQFGELTGEAYRYMANTILNAGYLQFDNQLTDWLRIIWGARIEDYDQLIGSKRASDPRHFHSRVTDVLPGVNITFKPTNRSNIRLSGSQTIVRPEFRELSPFAFYDFELNAQVQGKNTVQRSRITNADLRYEIYPRGGEVITAGVFYKYFEKPIEYYLNFTGPATTTFNVDNSKSATAFGVEFEFRKKLDFISRSLKNFTLSGNASYIYSRVEDTAALNRPLQGQSPYLLNASLMYDLQKHGLTTTLLFNQIGRRILFVGNEAIPEIWEHPRPLLDLQVAKKILDDRGEIRINISDIFNRRAFFYHDLDGNKKLNHEGKDVLAISRNYGTNYSITFSYKIK